MKRYGFMVWGFFCHFWIDFSCSWFIFQEVVGEAGWYTLLFFYNFFAFALELPLGVLLDRICEKNKGSLKGYSWTGIAGIFLVLLALYGDIPLWLGVFLAGFGNAAFHVGTGALVLAVFPEKIWPSGLFVSSGALGICLGKLLSGKTGMKIAMGIMLSLLFSTAVLGEATGKKKKKCREIQREKVPMATKGILPETAFDLLSVLCIFMTVVLRSYQGMALSFPWNQTVKTGLILAGATAAGKLAGGIGADLTGMKKTVALSLGLGGILLLQPSSMWSGTAGTLLFNMTMPITLVLLYRTFPKWPGISFGLLTFALFIGFLPSYFGVGSLPMPFGAGCLSFLSLILLWMTIKRRERAGQQGKSDQ